MKNVIHYLLCLLFLVNILSANTEAQITAIKGDVKVRFGLNENWQKAAVGEILRDIDTIFNGENATSSMKLVDGSTFTLGPNSVLDIADLRIILEKEMFLYLMSKKIDKIENKNIKTELRIGNVSVIHGEDAGTVSIQNTTRFLEEWSLKEINGAIALYNHNYFSNCIIKLHSVLARYDTLANKTEIYFYMARAFEAMDQKGQAIDAYQNLVSVLNSQKSLSAKNKMKLEEARLAIKNLSQ